MQKTFGVGDIEPRCTPPKGKIIATNGNPEVCSSLMMTCDSVINYQFFCLDAITNLFLNDKHMFTFANHALTIYLNFWILICFGTLRACFVMVISEIFYDSF